MPRRYRRRKKRTYKRRKKRTYKRRYTKKRRYTRRRRQLRLGGGLFAKSKIVKLRYVTTYVIAPTASTGLFTDVVFRANSIHDPEHATGGHQPYGSDEWADNYNNYQVLGSKCSTLFSSDTGDQKSSAQVTTMSNQFSALSVAHLKVNTNQENPSWNTGVKHLYPLGSTKSTVKSVATFSSTRDLKIAPNSDEQKVAFGYDPSGVGRVWYFHVCAGEYASMGVGYISCTTTIDYIVRLTDPVTIAPS